jgi:ADP-heptose:LPS heptosyltransferase
MRHTGPAHPPGPLRPGRVAILRALQLGDMLCAVPALRAFRAAWPAAEVVLVGLPWAYAFAARFRHLLDGFREFPGYPGLPERPPDIAELPGFFAALQAERFDLAVQLHGSGSFVNEVVTLFGARRTAGFFRPGDFVPDAALFRPWPETGLETTRLLTLAESLGAPGDGEALEFPVFESDRAALARALDGNVLTPGSYVCIHPGASVPERRWGAGRFAAVARALAARGLWVVLTGTGAERDLIAAVAGAVPGAVDLAGRTELGAVGALLEGARLLVCNDTGVSHVAAALRVPSVVISTGDNPARWSPADRRRHTVLCRESGVAVDQVVSHALALLGTFPHAGKGLGPGTREEADTACGVCAS